MKRILLFLLILLPTIVWGQVTIDISKTYSDSDSTWTTITVEDSLILENLASDNLVVLNPTSTGKVDTTETSDVSEVTLDSLRADYLGVNDELFIHGGDLRITDASGTDSSRIYDDGDTTRWESDNPIKIGESSIYYCL